MPSKSIFYVLEASIDMLATYAIRLAFLRSQNPYWDALEAALEALAKIRQMDVDVDIALFSIETYARVSEE